ncbi:MAG: branched-chain amino acid aminotransferase, partial [Myxococcales bacterium]|nr:branched-chain amino acid aminotransferase [Myxococcales bacterium]
MAREPILYLNGAWKRLSEAHISVLDQGFLLGDGVFDVVSAWKGSLFRLDEHLERLDQSLRAARLGLPLSREAWRDAVVETLRRNELRVASVGLFVT